MTNILLFIIAVSLAVIAYLAWKKMKERQTPLGWLEERMLFIEDHAPRIMASRMMGMYHSNSYVKLIAEISVKDASELYSQIQLFAAEYVDELNEKEEL